MLLIGGQTAGAQHHMLGLQNLPHVDIMKGITKFASSVPTTARCADFIAMAARESFNGNFGPSFLEIPRDVLDDKVDVSKAVIPTPGRYRASTKNIPTYMNGAARGTLGPDHPLALQLTRRDAFKDSDLTIVVGTPFDFRLGYGKSLKAPIVVQIDMGYANVGRNRDIQLGLVGDVGTILSAVLQATSGRTVGTGARARDPWLAELRAKETAAVDSRMPKLLNDSALIHPYRLAHEIDRFLTDNSIFIGDGGDVVTFAGNVVRPKGPGLWMDPGPLGTLGVGTGFALAAKIVHPEREVVTLFGDGSFAMTAFDMQTSIREKAPYIAIVGNNSYMNQIRFGQVAKYGKERGNVGNYLGDVNFEKFADMLGVYGEAVRDPAQIAPALQRARESGTCAVINVWLDPDAYAPGTENQTMYK